MDKRKGCCGKASKRLGLSLSKGFTLIELLVVIAIIGILATIVLVSLNAARIKARDTQRVADAKQFMTALEMYFDSNAGYPAGLSDLTTAGYMPTVPNDPLGTAYSYCVAATPTTYHLGITLEDDGNAALDNDADRGETGDEICATGDEFDGVDPMYDVAP